MIKNALYQSPTAAPLHLATQRPGVGIRPPGIGGNDEKNYK